MTEVRRLIAAGEDVHEKVRRDYPINAAAAGARADEPGRDGLRTLHNAVLSGHKDIVALLIQEGADVNAMEKRGRTPLYSFACAAGNDIEIARMLLAAGADPSIKDGENLETPLNCAVETGSPALTELLIAARLDVNDQNADGWSALHYAAYHLRHDIARVLIAAGAK